MKFKNRLGMTTTFKNWCYEWLEVLGYVGAHFCPRITYGIIELLTWIRTKKNKK